jgi:hypothetical protein
MERADIEAFIENEVGTIEKTRLHFQDFFSCTAHDMDKIPDDELKRFAIFSKHVLKRLLNASSQKFENLKERLHAAQVKGVAMVFPLLFHDISHAIGIIVQEYDDSERGNVHSVVPPFFTYKKGYGGNVEEVIVNELYGVFFDTIKVNGKYKNVALESALETIDFEGDYSDFESTYMDYVFEAIHEPNIKEYHTRKSIDPTFTQTESEFKTAYEEVVANIRMHVPSALRRMLKQVWKEYPSNKMVLFNVYKAHVDPYINGLVKRAEYRDFTFAHSE